MVAAFAGLARCLGPHCIHLLALDLIGNLLLLLLLEIFATISIVIIKVI